MKLYSLMEKAQAGPYKLLRQLLDHKGPHGLKDLQEETGFSKSTLLKYQEHLRERLGDWIVLQEDGEKISCQLALGVTSQEINQVFLADAVRYQILLYLLRHQRFSIQHLAAELLISDATLNRHLASLNKLLAEFDLKIVSGQLKGPEQQIRYFYCQLLSLTWTRSQLQRHTPPALIEKEILLVERLMQAELTPEGKHLVAIWTYVSKKRLAQAGKDGQALRQLLEPFEDNVFYQRARLETLRYLSRYALEVDELEAMLLFAFLVTSFVLPLHTMEYILGFGGPIGEKMTQTLRYLRGQGLLGDYTSEHVTYQLSQLFGQTYFYKGRIRLSSCEYAPDSLGLDDGHLDMIKQMLQYFPADLPPAQEQKIRWELGHTLFYILEKEHAGLRIGMDLDAREILYYRMVHDLQVSLENNRLIHVEAYQAGQAYDLIVSNQLLKDYGDNPVYYLQSQLNQADQEAIRSHILERMKQ